MLRSDNLLNDLEIFCIKNKISKNNIVLFGSIVLGLHGLRYPNDLDIGLLKPEFENLQIETKKQNCKIGSYCAQMDFGDLSFIHEYALPKINNQNLFNLKLEKVLGFKIINFEQWKQMQMNDPLKKDIRFIK